MMTSLARRVLRAIRDGSLLPAGERVVVAVSGGADSVALAWLLHELSGDAVWQLTGLVHVHHGLRHDEADADEALCRSLARRVGVPIDVTRGDAGARARDTRRSIEAAARDLRYEAFGRALERLGGTVVATGHTLDDQAETVLLRLLRGAGTRGLAGIRPRRDRVTRPLLDCRRADLREYLSARGESFREDSSNQDVSIPRNRVRHELLPVIERLAPGGIPALARCAALAADDEAYLRAAVEVEGADVVVSRPGATSAELDTGRLNALAPALARRLIRDLAEAITGTTWGATHIETVLDLARADTGTGQLDLPSAVARRQGARLRIAHAEPKSARDEGQAADGVARRLPVPGDVAMGEPGGTIFATLERTVDAAISSEQNRAVVGASGLDLPLAVRFRRPGDRFRPLGAPGSRKLQDVFVDRKVPRSERDRIPIVVDSRDRIVWVAGVAMAHEWRVTGAHKEVVVLELKR